MKLIVGLGNPGEQYENTRHNVGFMVCDTLAHDLGESFKLWGPGKIAELAQAQIDGEKVILLKPLTFMNESGNAVVAAAGFFKILPEDICAIHDELDIAPGSVRLKTGGGDAGHNGLKSLTKHLSTPNYARVRMGIGRPPHPSMDVADFVLGSFSRDEEALLDPMIDKAIEGVRAFCAGSDAFTRAMNTMNRKD